MQYLRGTVLVIFHLCGYNRAPSGWPGPDLPSFLPSPQMKNTKNTLTSNQPCQHERLPTRPPPGVGTLAKGRCCGGPRTRAISAHAGQRNELVENTAVAVAVAVVARTAVDFDLGTVAATHGTKKVKPLHRSTRYCRCRGLKAASESVVQL